MSHSDRTYLKYLADAGKILSSSLDLRATLDNVGQIIVPSIADWCALTLLDRRDGKTLYIPLVAHFIPEKQLLMRRGSEVELTDGFGPGAVIGSGKTEITDEITDEMVIAMGKTPELIEVWRKVGLKSSLCVPLEVRGRVFGSLGIGQTDSPRRFEASDIHFVEELARLCSLAIENAHLYQEAQAGIRTREEFIAVASHELKTPLTSLALQVYRLKELAEPDTQIGRLTKMAEQQVQRLKRLANDLLDVRRVREGNLPLHKEMLDLAAITTDLACRTERESTFGKTGKIGLCIPEDPVNGLWDRIRIEEVILNLLGNAIKYGEGKPIQIALSRSDGIATLKVQDQGIGIPYADRARIFEPFERAVPIEHYGGLGVGLHICREIVTAHGGEISVESQEGVGSTFTVRLPLE